MHPEQFFRVVIAALVRRFLGMPPLMPRSTMRSSADAYPKAPASPSAGNALHADWGQAFADNLNRNVMAEHEEELAKIPAYIRATKSEEEWRETPRLEILKLARDWEAAEALSAVSLAVPQHTQEVGSDGDHSHIAR